jgi:hypothetical protein
VSLTAGTILHNTKTPLTHWFWAAYLMTTDKRGVSENNRISRTRLTERLSWQSVLGISGSVWLSLALFLAIIEASAGLNPRS